MQDVKLRVIERGHAGGLVKRGLGALGEIDTDKNGFELVHLEVG